ncbi:hypothetical protein M8818_003493 [Zalaria obscura]|uniref:Uncharacterized protein n=1 Tax=Zalaria obscura TaxID=2024903 RepID=A0ACC3SFA5_9PEZI
MDGLGGDMMQGIDMGSGVNVGVDMGGDAVAGAAQMGDAGATDFSDMANLGVDANSGMGNLDMGQMGDSVRTPFLLLRKDQSSHNCSSSPQSQARPHSHDTEPHSTAIFGSAAVSYCAQIPVKQGETTKIIDRSSFPTGGTVTATVVDSQEESPSLANHFSMGLLDGRLGIFGLR